MNNTKNANLRKRPVVHDTPRNWILEPEVCNWLDRLQKGPIVWKDGLPRAIAAQCREAGWTRVRVIQPNCEVIHELTDSGLSVLLTYRHARELLDAQEEARQDTAVASPQSRAPIR